jgi:hypothetical protein
MCWRVLAIVLTLSAAVAAPAEARRYRAYVACGVADTTYRPPPSHSCPVGDLPHAVLIDRLRSHSRYRLCVRVPSGAQYCNRHRTARRGRLSQRALYNDTLGRHIIRWYAHGHLIERWTLRRTIGD